MIPLLVPVCSLLIFFFIAEKVLVLPKSY